MEKPLLAEIAGLEKTNQGGVVERKKKGNDHYFEGKSSGLVLTEHLSVNCPLCVQREPLQRDSTFAFKD